MNKGDFGISRSFASPFLKDYKNDLLSYIHRDDVVEVISSLVRIFVVMLSAVYFAIVKHFKYSGFCPIRVDSSIDNLFMI